MLSRFKFMKPLGISLPAVSQLAAFGGCLLAIAVSGAPARAADDKASCEQELPGFFQVIENLQDEKKADPEKIDDAYLAANCNDSDRSEVNKSHTTRVGSTDLGGACRASHLLIRKHYDELKSAHADYCEQVEESTKASEQCLGKDSKEDIESCLKQMRDNLADIKAKHKIVIKIAEGAGKELKAAQEQNKKVGDKFIEDKHKFDLGTPKENELVAMNGFANEDEYRKLVQTDITKPVPRNIHNSKVSEGALIDEQRLAGDNITHYLAGLDQYKNKKAAGEAKVNEQIAALSKKAKENNSEDKGLGKYVPAAAAAAPAAQSLMGKNGSTASSSSGPGISGAVAALPAAAALIGAAKGNSGASSASPTPSSGSAPSSHETPTTALGGAAVAAGNRAPASNNNTEPKTNATEAKKDESTGGFTPMNLSSDGSSRMGTVKKGAKATEENSGPAQATSYANNGVDAGGGMSLNSHGGSHSNTPAPGTEVTSLLGQMKSLFNFDDPAGTGGGNGGGVFGGAMPAMAPGMPGSGETGQAGAYPENGTYNPEAVASNGEASTVEQGAAPDNQSDSLFVRVHKRHRRAEERGMVRGV